MNANYNNSNQNNVLLDFIKKNERLVIAEGYLFEFCRRGRVKMGSLVPEVILDNPECLRALHQEFVDAGTDVVQAFTYYIHRTKLQAIGRENDLEKINKAALAIAKQVAIENDKLFAGGLCNSNHWDPDKPETVELTRQMFKEQVQWAAEAGVDYMVAETFWDYGEASLALEVIKQIAPNMPTVITICPAGPSDKTFDDVPIVEALTMLKQEGADVVGLNCQRGPATMLPLILDVRKEVPGPIACNPVCFRTSNEAHTFSRLKYPDSDDTCYPHDVHMYTCSMREIAEFGKQCKSNGIEYIGLCCGNNPSLMKTLTEAVGKNSYLSKYGLDRHNNVLARQESSDELLPNAGKSEIMEPSRYDKITKFTGLL